VLGYGSMCACAVPHGAREDGLRLPRSSRTALKLSGAQLAMAPPPCLRPPSRPSGETPASVEAQRSAPLWTTPEGGVAPVLTGWVIESAKKAGPSRSVARSPFREFGRVIGCGLLPAMDIGKDAAADTRLRRGSRRCQVARAEVACAAACGDGALAGEGLEVGDHRLCRAQNRQDVVGVEDLADADADLGTQAIGARLPESATAVAQRC
jgi:hypothetical protein